MANRSIAELSADAAILISELGKREKGSTVTYEEFEKLIGYDVRNNRGILVTVKNRLLRDHELVLDSVPKVGYRILSDAEVVEGLLRTDRERRRRAATKSKQKAAVVDMSKLNEMQKISYLAEVTVAHVVIDSSGDKSIKQLSLSLSGATAPLALNNALDALKKNLG
jgi:hypothetical protein